MPLIAGVTIPDNKTIDAALTSIHGVGWALSKKILKQANIEAHKRAKELTAEEVNRIREIIEKEYTIEGDLRREKMMAIKRLRDIGSWRGQRHAKGLPVRGQSTKSNSRTVRGNTRRTVGSGRKAPPSPT